MEMKGPQSSDITPVFRMTKAQPIRNQNGFVRKAMGDVQKSSRNVPAGRARAETQQEVMPQHYLFSNAEGKTIICKPMSFDQNSDNSVIKIVDI